MSGLITNPAAIWLAVAPMDMRRGIDGLSMVVQQALGHAPCSGSAFVFRNRSGTRIKVVVTASGFVCRYLERGCRRC